MHVKVFQWLQLVFFSFDSTLFLSKVCCVTRQLVLMNIFKGFFTLPLNFLPSYSLPLYGKLARLSLSFTSSLVDYKKGKKVTRMKSLSEA